VVTRVLLLSTAEKRLAIQRHTEGHTPDQLAATLAVPVAWVTRCDSQPDSSQEDRPRKPSKPKEPRGRKARDKAEVHTLNDVLGDTYDPARDTKCEVSPSGAAAPR
jgi:hypothetical protein